jgi:Domain of unknown function (DU1801)
MNLSDQINAYLSALSEPKQQEMRTLHHHIELISPNSKRWFDNGLNEESKVVTNPTIGYGNQTLKYADGSSKEFFQIGLSANATGISIYIMGIKDKTQLPQRFAETIGKAKVTGYCIKFKKLSDIHLDILESAIQFGLDTTSPN